MGILDEQSGGGKYEVTMQLNKPPAGATAVFTIEAPTAQQAEQEAMIKAREKWKTVPEPYSITHMGTKNLWSKAQSDLLSEGMDNTLGNISVAVDGLSNSKEFKEIITSFKKLEKLMDNPGFKKVVGKIDDFGSAIPKGVSKTLGPLGKGFSALDVFTEFRKIAGYFDRLLGTTDKDLIKKLVHDITLSFAKITKTIVSTAIPVVGLVDFGATVVMMAYGAVSDIVIEQKDAVKKAQYDQQKDALKPDNRKYETEWKLYASGISMADILEIRSHQNDWYKRIGADEDWLRVTGVLQTFVYTVNYDTDGGTPSSIPSKTVKWDESDMNPTTRPTKTGYVLGGWYLSYPDRIISPHAKYKDLALDYSVKSITLKAKWNADKNFTVNYNTDGGSPGFPSKTVKFNDTNLLPPSNPTKKGFDFKGWNVTLGGYGNNVTNSNPYSSLATSENSPAITLKAQWTLASAAPAPAPATPISVTVSFNTSGGTPTPASKSVTVDSTYGPLPAVTKAGSNFEGWFNAATGGTKIEPSTKVVNKSAHSLFAHWSVPSGITVNFDPKGGSSNPASKSVTPDSTYGSLPAVARDGYKFEGWFNAASGGAKIESSTKVTNKSAHTLFAHWTAINVTVAFNINGGKPPVPLNKILPFDSNYGSLPTAARDGYKLDGWYTAATGGTKIEASTKVTNKSAHTLYAHWAGSTLTLTFNSNGGSAPNPATRQMAVGSPYGTLPTVTRDGYKFDGWFNVASGGAKIDPSGPFSGNVTTIYAHWTAESGITVTFEANGGTPIPASKAVTFGANYSLPTVSRPGYKFEGWFTAATGGTKVEGATKVSNTASHTLYARWSAISVTVTFNSNGGSAPNPVNKAVTNGSAYGTLPNVTKTGSTFDGWYTAATGGTKIEPSSIVSNAGNHALYARWSGNTFTVTFHRNGAENFNEPIPQISAVYNSRITLPAPPTRPDYTFEGWNTKADGSGTVFNAGTPVTADIGVYAKWKAVPPKIVTITFNANGGTPNPATRQITVGSPLGTLPTVTKVGCKFDGWYNAASDGGKINSTDPISGNYTTFYAYWTENTYTVTFHRNGAENFNQPIPQVTAAYNSKVTLPAPPTRPDFTFEGWNTKADGNGTVFNAGTPITADIGVYAKWKAVPPKVITITFNANGGTPNTSSQVTVGSPLGTLPKVNREGFRFDGWYNAASGGGKINSSDPISGNYTTFYAHWTEITYTVTFHRNGGTSDAIPQVTVAQNGRITLPRQPTRPGYTFAGWFWDSRGITPFSTSTPITGDFEFYAHWNENASASPQPTPQPPTPTPSTPTCTVTFHRNGAENYNSPIPQITADCNSRISLPSSPSWPGYTFIGWNTSGHGTGTAFTGDIPNTSTLAVYAIWRADASAPVQQPASNTMTLSFNSNGGSAPNPASKVLTVGGKIGPMPTVSKPGNTFDGWYTPNGTKLTQDHEYRGTYTEVIAHWK